MKKLEEQQIKDLILQAKNARTLSYSPYSHFQVGAALLTEDGSIYTGCNVENASYSATNCAERTAVFKAVSENERVFVAIAIVGGKEYTKGEICPPCGVCRQVLAEFCDADNFSVILAIDENEYKIYTLDTLLPVRFSLKSQDI